MKKLIFGMSALVVLFSSCSGSDDEGSSNNNTILLKKTVENGPEGEVITTATYNGTKISRITTSNGTTIDFTYTGDNITKMLWKSDGIVFQEDLYTYAADGRLDTHVMLDHDMQWGSREVYSYTGQTSATVQNFSGNLASQTLPGETHTITFQNGEVAQITKPSETLTYTYDDKNNPFKNVTGYSKITFVDGGASGIMHNVTAEASTGGGSTTYTYTYNSNNFPATATENWDGDVYTTTFTYQQ